MFLLQKRLNLKKTLLKYKFLHVIIYPQACLGCSCTTNGSAWGLWVRWLYDVRCPGEISIVALFPCLNEKNGWKMKKNIKARVTLPMTTKLMANPLPFSTMPYFTWAKQITEITKDISYTLIKHTWKLIRKQWKN